jgi:hypothetical protein
MNGANREIGGPGARRIVIQRDLSRPFAWTGILI